MLHDRFATQAFIERTYREHALVHSLDPQRATQLGAFLDGVEAALAQDAVDPFYPVQAKFSLALGMLAELMPFAPDPAEDAAPLAALRSGDFRARYAPVRDDLRNLFRALHTDLARRWTVAEIAEIAHVSPRQLTRIFAEALGPHHCQCSRRCERWR